MAKQIQDITPPEKRSIRNIPISTSRRVFSPRVSDVSARGNGSASGTSAGGKETSRAVLWGIAFVSLVILITALSAVFASTTFEVTPKVETVSFDQDIMAYREVKDPAVSLVYTVMTVVREATRSVEATGEEAVSRVASGKIIIYNKYSTAGQRLIKNTRFESPDGLIFRIKDPITVPGAKKVNGELVPDSVEAVVYADQPGDRYNISLSDFTIPGFKGDPRYTAFYARSKEVFTGGFVGTVKRVDQMVRETTIAELKEKLSKEIDAEATAEKPEGFILYDQAKFVTFTTLPDSVVDGKAVLGVRATLSAVIFDGAQLATTIAQQSVRGYGDEPVYSPDLSQLNFFLDRNKVRLDTDKQITFHLAGQTRIVYRLNEASFIRDVAGIEASALPSVLKKYPHIEHIETIPRPFWAKTVPLEPEKIKVVITVPEK